MNVGRWTLARITTIALSIYAMAVPGSADESKKTSPQKPQRVSFLIRGAHCDEGLDVLRKTLAGVKGIRFKPEDIQAGKKPKWFSDPFVVEFRTPDRDPLKPNVGAFAKAIGDARTPHRDDLPPKLNLVLYTPDDIDEPAVMALRSELMDVNGVEVLEPGGLGGMPRRGFYWIQLENAGGAALKDVLDACKRADVKVSTTKPE